LEADPGMSRILSALQGQTGLGKTLRQAHWREASSYPEWWIERSGLLVDLVKKSPFAEEISSFSEYGCGPNKPFKNSLRSHGISAPCHSLDLRAWDEDTIAINLDAAKAEDLPDSHCGVLSGVIEYLKQPDEALRRLSSKHPFLLFSYCYAQLPDMKRVDDKVKLLAERSGRGWRNHLSIEELVSFVGTFGYICEITHWRDQVLILTARFGQD
jgi:hypothetical protein